MLDSIAEDLGITYTEYDLTHVTATSDELLSREQTEISAWVGVGLELSFRDVGGNLWRRDARGSLHALSS